MDDFTAKIKELQEKIQNIYRALNISGFKAELADLEGEMEEPNFWANQNRAKEISQKAADLKDTLNTWDSISKETSSLLDLVLEMEHSGDASFTQEELEKKFKELSDKFKELEFFALFSGEHDKNDAIVAIHAGTGGTDAQDWAQMLLRMILRYAEKKKLKVNIMDESAGQEAGIKSVTMEIKGHFAYGFLKSESGVHRLVRISPFDAEKMRHTSFALIEVLPELGEIDAKDFPIEDKDLRIDVFRAGGHGGQSVNTTDSAVRLTHLPTGIVVTCQNERSQLQNKESALRYLKSKLHHLKILERRQEKEKIRGEYHKAAWGNQIRSYVLHPYKLVKDHRTEYETQEVERVLNGEFDDFVESYLKSQISKKE